MDILVVVDMQNDFVSGTLGSEEAKAIVPNVVDKIGAFEGMVFYTKDTHGDDYLETLEGKNLPVPHCILGTEGHDIISEIKAVDTTRVINKDTFGSVELYDFITHACKEEITSITLIGLCTDICVISNAMLLKAATVNTAIIVDSSCCAGVTPGTHKNALEAMKMCQIEVV